LVTRFLGKAKKMNREIVKRSVKHIHEGRYVADVEVDLIYDDLPWSPTITPADIEKLERVRLALRDGDLKAAAREARVFELMPLAGE
jgi:predicted transcriptional regulator